METNLGIPVFISLVSVASYDGLADDPIRMMTSGHLFPGKEFSTLRYQEIQQDSETGQVTESEIQLFLWKNQVTMNRLGSFSNTMLFRENQRFETRYHTPYGDMDMSVFTRNVQWNEQEGNGKIHLRYDLNLQGRYASTNELNLEYQRK